IRSHLMRAHYNAAVVDAAWCGYVGSEAQVPEMSVLPHEANRRLSSGRGRHSTSHDGTKAIDAIDSGRCCAGKIECNRVSSGADEPVKRFRLIASNHNARSASFRCRFYGGIHIRNFAATAEAAVSEANKRM